MVKRKVLASGLEKTLQEYARLLKRSGLEVSEVILFGSFARGLSKEYSDIDVCVVSPRFGRDQTKEMVRLNVLAYEVDPRIEATPYSPKDLAVKEDPLAHEIRTTGISIALDRLAESRR